MIYMCNLRILGLTTCCFNLRYCFVRGQLTCVCVFLFLHTHNCKLLGNLPPALPCVTYCYRGLALFNEFCHHHLTFFQNRRPSDVSGTPSKSRSFSPSKLIQNAGWDKSLLSLYKSKLEVTTTRNLKIWYQGLDDTCWWTTIINQQSTSFPKWWFQILSWNHQLEPLTTFRTRTVGLATSLSSCFYTIRLEWHLDDWGKSCHSFWFRIWCVCFSSKHSVCILCGMPGSVCISLYIHGLYFRV